MSAGKGIEMAEQLINLRALRNEREWLPRSLDDAILIRQTLMSAGISRAKADGILGWLLGKVKGEIDTTTATVRSDYRKVLAELQSPLLVQADAIPR
jgi:hypothetical protein